MVNAIPESAHEENDARRCVACGFEFNLVYEARCPKCNAVLPAEWVTSGDTTPFARDHRRNRPARRAMRFWVYTAGAERLRHLSLVRSSAASAAFARSHVFRLAGAAVLFELSRTGWHYVVRTAENASLLAAEPAGRSWLPVAVADTAAHRLGCVAVWWNPGRSAVALIAACVTGLVVAYGAIVVLNIGAWRVIGRPHRDQQRLRAAIHYSTAWGQPLVYASFLLVATPLVRVLGIWGVPFVPSTTWVDGAAALLAGLAALMWWFWLVRLAYALPADARARTMVYYTAVAPVLVGGLLYGALTALDSLFEFSWPLLDLKW